MHTPSFVSQSHFLTPVFGIPFKECGLSNKAQMLSFGVRRKSGIAVFNPVFSFLSLGFQGILLPGIPWSTQTGPVASPLPVFTQTSPFIPSGTPPVRGHLPGWAVTAVSPSAVGCILHELPFYAPVLSPELTGLCLRAPCLLTPSLAQRSSVSWLGWWAVGPGKTQEEKAF